MRMWSLAIMKDFVLPGVSVCMYMYHQEGGSNLDETQVSTVTDPLQRDDAKASVL